jgi:hypothetical protein
MVENIKKLNLNQKENTSTAPEAVSAVSDTTDANKMNLNNMDSGNKKKGRFKNLFKFAWFKNMPKGVKIGLSFFLGLFLLALVLIVPILVLATPVAANLKATYLLAQEAGQAAKDQNLPLVEEKLKLTHEKLLVAQKSYSRLTWTKFIPVLGNYYQDGDSFLKAGSLGLEAAQIMVESVTPYADVLGFEGKGSFSGGTAQERIKRIIETLDKVTPKIEEVKNKLNQASNQLSEVDPNHYPKTIKSITVREKILKAKNLVSEASAAAAEAQPALEVLPEILGYPEARKYLVIMQNDGELRPTGGFMTAYAVIKVEAGTVIPEVSSDIYSLDEKSTEKVKAPEPIKKYLFSAHLGTGIVPYWYLRDMNLSPDFKVSMETFYKHYLEVPGISEVDGIIAIDTKVLKDFLTILGSINVPGYGEFTMNPDPRCHDIPQVVCELEHIVDTPIAGVKRGRKDILGPMMKTLIAKIFDSPSEMWPGIFRLGIQEMEEKHVLYYFHKPEYQKAAETLNSAGRIKDFAGDFLHVNDTNFGGAKSNLFVEHEVEQAITVNEDGSLEKKVTLTYINPKPMDNCNLERVGTLCLNGILRNWFRVYVPRGSELIEGLGSEEEIQTYDELDKTVFEGFFILRGDGGRAKVVLTYKLPFKINSLSDYNLLIQKQPGTVGHSYTVLAGDKKQEFKLTTDRQLTF